MCPEWKPRKDLRAMRIKDIMTTDVKTVSEKSAINEAAKIMSEFQIGCLIVADKGLLEGIITERDIMREVVSKNRIPSDVKVQDVMTKEVVAVRPDMEIEEAAKIMSERKIKRLPVLYKNSIVGIVSSVDIVAAEPKMMEQIAGLVLFSSKQRAGAG